MNSHLKLCGPWGVDAALIGVVVGFGIAYDVAMAWNPLAQDLGIGFPCHI